MEDATGLGMRFLIKLTLLAIIGLAILPAVVPADYRDEAHASGDTTAPSAMQLLLSAGQFVHDIGGICERQPAFCDTAKHLAVYTGTKAREGAHIVYGMWKGEADATGGDQADTAATDTSAG